MTDWDEFIMRRIREMSGMANVGDIVFMTMERTSPHFIQMAICLNFNINLMEIGYLTDESYMSRFDFFTREFTILVRGAATPNVISQFYNQKEAIRNLYFYNGKDDVQSKTENYQYLLRNANIPSQEEAKRIIGLPSNF